MNRIILTIFLLLLTALTAHAHPMGNFSTNHYATLRIERDGLHLQYRIDFAEIPTSAELHSLEPDHNAYLSARSQSWTPNIHLLVNKLPAPLQQTTSDLKLTPGSGNLPTLLITINYLIPIKTNNNIATIEYTDQNYLDRAGARSLILLAGDGCWITPPTPTLTDRAKSLIVYPPTLQGAPPDSKATFTISLTPGPSTTPTPAITPIPTPTTPPDRLSTLISQGSKSWPLLATALAASFILGAFHALSPGHGKTVVAAYLVGSHGTPIHALLLGIVVTLTHTSGVFILGLVVLFASSYISPDTIYPWLGFLSGMLIASIGGWQLIRRSLANSNTPVHTHGPGGHSHDIPQNVTPLSLLALGISGGLVPCPSALLLLLGSIAAHQITLGLLLTTSFSIGLALVLISIGLAVLYSRSLLTRLSWHPPLTRHLPLLSAAVVTIIGLLIALRAATDAHLTFFSR